MSELKSLESKIIKDIYIRSYDNSINLFYSNLEDRVMIDKMCSEDTLFSFNIDSLVFITDDNFNYVFKHEQDCCETVRLKEIDGDLSDIYDQTVISIEEVSNENKIEGDYDCYSDSYTYTYYKIKTNKGDITFSWYGESNGYYTEKPNFYILKK